MKSTIEEARKAAQFTANTLKQDVAIIETGDEHQLVMLSELSGNGEYGFSQHGQSVNVVGIFIPNL